MGKISKMVVIESLTYICVVQIRDPYPSFHYFTVIDS